MISIAYGGLFAWQFFLKPKGLNQLIQVGVVPGLLAITSIIFAAITYFLYPKKKSYLTDTPLFLIVSALVAIQVYATGGFNSPFVALWVIIATLSGAFGIIGSLSILLASIAYLVILFIGSRLSLDSVLIVSLSGIAPLIFSLIFWHAVEESYEETPENRAYKNLAKEYSEVTSQSDVVINAIGDGVIVIDGKGVIQLINPAAQTITGWSKSNALGLNYKSVLKMIDDRDNQITPTDDPIQQSLNTNQEYRVNNLTLLTNSQKKLILSLVSSPVGEMGSGAIAVFRDITKEKAEEREQAEFISTASHEMRTPVASIEGYLGLTLNPTTATIDDRARNYIDKAHEATKRLGQLFQDLLDISKSEDGRMTNNPSVVDIVTFVGEIVEEYRNKAESRGLTLKFMPSASTLSNKIIKPVYFVNLDNNHIREIVNNLVDNAIKYTMAGDVIVNVEGVDDERVRISVKDSGIGIPAEDLPHLFQKFYRVENKDTREIGGTGLGLYLCRKLAELMGGRIWVESIYTEGSTFYLELPRIGSQEAIRAKATVNAINQQDSLASVIPRQQTMQPIIKPQQPLNPIQPKPTTQIINHTVADSGNKVPRGQALTKEQIAAYVARQRMLAQQSAKENDENHTVVPATPQSATVTTAQRPAASLSVPQRLIQ